MLPRLSAAFLAAFYLVGCASSESAAALRGDGPARAQQAAFLNQLEEILGLGHREATEARLGEITQALQTTFRSLPKNARGAVSASSARFAIHRLFVQRHGWHVKGLAPQSGSWTTSAPALGMDGRLPQSLVDLVEEQLAHDDFQLREMAVLAATIETMIHGEVLGRLNRTYQAFGWDVKTILGKDDAVQIMNTYMTAFLAGYNVSQFTPQRLHEARDHIMLTYPYWRPMEELLRDMHQKLAPGRRDYAFSDILSILEAVNERVGVRVDESNCGDISRRLMQMEEAKGTGRVRLRDFYASHLQEGNWQFQERVEFLRQLGVLDESDPSATRLMIPNYLNMQANCVNVSNFYDLCCMDKCEDLLGHLESQIQAPHAPPERILSLVAGLPSAHGPSEQNLSASLVTKLHEVAQHHGGLVPLHGRLFAQWMHFVYPRDCPYPHVAGTTKIMLDTDWSEETGMASYFTHDEMQSYIASVESSSHDAGSSALVTEETEDEEMCTAGMWAPDEALVDAVHGKPLPPPPPRTSSIRSFMRLAALLAVMMSSVIVMKEVALQSLKSLARESGVKTLLPEWGVKGATSFV